jgi:8-hydroxy-5-deazaflavin:NADPH oxidoreductase
MKIGIIGTGNVGGALALGWAKVRHEIIIGAKDSNSDKVKKVKSQISTVKVKSVKEASNDAEVILIAATSSAVAEISKELGDVKIKSLLTL